MTRAPWGFAGMLLAVAAVESWVADRPERFTDPASLGWRASAEAASGVAVDADVLILGDSLAKHGLLPARLAAMTGRAAYNLAAPAAPVPLAYFLLRRALDAGARPSAIVVDLAPDLLAGGPGYRERSWPEALSTGEIMELAIEARSASLPARVVVGRWSATCRGRFEVRAAVVSALRGEPSRLEGSNRAMLAAWRRDLGANRDGDAPPFDGRVSEADHRRLMDHAFRVHRVNARYLDKLLRLAEGRGIAVRLLVPPVAPEVQARRDAVGADAAYTAFLTEIAREHPGVVVLDARRLGLDARSFVDPIHLGAAGAGALTGAVAARLDARSTAWVTLGPRPIVAQSTDPHADARGRR